MGRFLYGVCKGSGKASLGFGKFEKQHGEGMVQRMDIVGWGKFGWGK